MNAEHPPAVARHVDQLDNIEELDEDSELDRAAYFEELDRPLTQLRIPTTAGISELAGRRPPSATFEDFRQITPDAFNHRSPPIATENSADEHGFRLVDVGVAVVVDAAAVRRPAGQPALLGLPSLVLLEWKFHKRKRYPVPQV